MLKDTAGNRAGMPNLPMTAGFWQQLQSWVSRPWFSYATILLLQSKAMWGMWTYRDLTPGDESAYYVRAYMWYQNLQVDIAWSPLYTAFYGSLMHLSPQAYFVTMLHRVIVVLVLCMLILTLMRRLLPHGIAWIITAWWVILPINFDAVFTVHLFAIIPVLIAWLVALYRQTPWTRGAALAILLAAATLMRNEYMVAVIAFAAICLWWELRMAPHIETFPVRNLQVYLASYGIPLLLCGALVLFFYVRSVFQFPALFESSKPKHTINMCQVYAFGYQQRHPEWTRSPWLECSELMQVTFGQPMPTLSEMLRSNPGVVLEHFWWNISLVPNGLQVLLFSETSGTVSPDYAPVILRSTRALMGSIVVGAILAAGLFLLYREHRYWWKYWLKDRAIGWLTMLSVVVVAFLIIPTQRPRPSYLFAQGLTIMALIGMCLFVISRRVPSVRFISIALSVLVALVVLVTPGRYFRDYRLMGRPLLELYQRLIPFEMTFNRQNTLFLVNSYVMDVHGYVSHNYSTNPFANFDYSLLDQAPPDVPLETFLDQKGVNLFYIDEALFAKLESHPVYHRFVDSPEAAGWYILTYQNTDRGQWMLLQKHAKSNAYSLR